jgi:predicted nucleic acid-binding protein
MKNRPTPDKRKKIYLDTSAFLCFLLNETGHEKIDRVIKNSLLYSSSFMILETERTLVHLCREKKIKTQDYDAIYPAAQVCIKSMAFYELTVDLCSNQDFPAIKTPRSADLVHLRTAKWLIENAGVDGFLSVDRHQLESAREMKIPIFEI